jgi:hypothetical protein
MRVHGSAAFGFVAAGAIFFGAQTALDLVTPAARMARVTSP